MLALFLLFFESLVIERTTGRKQQAVCCEVSISELRVLLLREISSPVGESPFQSRFNLRIESLVIERQNQGLFLLCLGHCFNLRIESLVIESAAIPRRYD